MKSSVRRTCALLAASLIVLASSLSAVALGSCRKREVRSAPLIGFSMDSFVVERWARDRDIFMAKAKELGADVILQVGQEDAAVQERQVEYLIGQGVDVLVVIPNDATRLTRLAVQARKKGIPVVCYDRLIKNARSDLFVSFDSHKVGELQAEGLLRFVKSGNVAILNGASTDNNAVLYHQGYMDVLKPSIDEGRIKIVWDEWPSTWRSEWASDSMQAIFGKGIKLSGVIAADDMLAEAAISVLAEHRLAGKVPVMGHDAELSACQRLVAGTQSMTVYKPLRELATKAAEFAVQLAEHRAIQVTDTINDGTYDIPYYRIQPLAVYRDNLDETVIKDGFHSREDIYQTAAKPKE